MLGEPLCPVWPPRARVLGGDVQPLLERLRLLSVGPVLVLDLFGWIDDAGNVAGARKYEFDRTAEQRRSGEDGLRRCDVVLLRGELKHRELDLTHSEPRS